MTNANWQPVKNSCKRDWGQSVQDVECELNGAKCKIFARHESGGEYGSNYKEVEWTVERFEKATQILDMSGGIATDESALKEDFELAKKRAEAFAMCWDAPTRTDLFFNKWERDNNPKDWFDPDDKQWKIGTPGTACRVNGVQGKVWAEKDNNGLKRIMWVVSVWEHSPQGLVWALRVRGAIYTSDSSLASDYELGKRRANEFALCWVEGKNK